MFKEFFEILAYIWGQVLRPPLKEYKVEDWNTSPEYRDLSVDGDDNGNK